MNYSSYTKLKGRMFERGVTQKDLQVITGRGQSYVTTRVNQHKPWTCKEMKAIGELLEIPQEQWAEYFV